MHHVVFGDPGPNFMGSTPKASTVVDDDLDHDMVASTAAADIAAAVPVPRHLLYLLEAMVAANLIVYYCLLFASVRCIRVLTSKY
jgi:hypothetical protein